MARNCWVQKLCWQTEVAASPLVQLILPPTSSSLPHLMSEISLQEHKVHAAIVKMMKLDVQNSVLYRQLL